MDTSPATGLPGDRPVAGPGKGAQAKFSRVAPREQIGAVAGTLEGNGITCIVVDSTEEARTAVRSILPVGAEVYNNTSRTLEVIGVAALTEEGSLLIASASGSQLGPIGSGAGHVILVVGAQKIVPDLDTGLRRIYEYCFPLEDRRARQAYGVPSGVNNVLVINKAIAPGRITAILVNKPLGF